MRLKILSFIFTLLTCSYGLYAQKGTQKANYHSSSTYVREIPALAKMDNIISVEEKVRRSKMLRSLSEKKKRIFYESQINKIKHVLFETENKSGYIHGFTENYVKVKIPWNPYLCNKLVKVKLTEIDDEGFMKAKVKEKIKERETLYSYSNW